MPGGQRMSSFGIHGEVKGVGETRYPSRVREVALNRERADDQSRLADLEEHVRHQRREPRRDSVEVHSDKAGTPPPPKPAPRRKAPAAGGEHLDITI